ncbi:cyclase family protein [soil metagenome]
MNKEIIFGGCGVDTDRPVDISIPLKFNGPQPNAFGVERAASEPWRTGELVGDTRHGGSCNFEKYTFIPHCSGTHTECVGHITDERISIVDCLRDVFIQAVLISVEPVAVEGVSDSYAVPFGSGDRAITRALLSVAITPQAAYAGRRAGVPIALILRTLPNDDTKLERSYGEVPLPPYFTTEAMEYIVECGFTHLLVDTPSIDRLSDEGKLSNHRIFWNVEQGAKVVRDDTRMTSTITEMIYVADEVSDGEYLLNLQIAPFAADASPSRPLLFRYL